MEWLAHEVTYVLVRWGYLALAVALLGENAGLPLRKFFIANVLGAASWVTTIAMSGYLFANKFESLVGYIEKVSWAITGSIFAVGYLVWPTKKKHVRERKPVA
jgi:membrane protein DedA with SNARE-associated domain